MEKEKRIQCDIDYQMEDNKYKRYHISKYVDDYKTGFNEITQQPADIERLSKNVKCSTSWKPFRIWEKLEPLKLG